MKKISVIIALLASTTLIFAEQSGTERFEKVVNKMIKAINDANYPEIQRDFDKIMLDAFPLEKSKPFFQGLVAQYGKIQKLDKPKLSSPIEAVFAARFEKGVLDIKVVLNDNNKIIGLWFLPHTADLPVPEKNQTQLSLPFKGSWEVGWGGDTEELNQHHSVPNQQFAYDFIGVGENGKNRKGSGETNEDYFAFGREVLSPAEGVVTDVINGVRDNTPGSMNPYSAIGNAVFIQHSKLEVSVLAHLKKDSITAKAGDKVKKGQVIGLCGNSGNSSEPHIHYHLQNTPIIQDGTGIKCCFEKMTLNGSKKMVKLNYSPIKGDIIIAE
jgi:murein DD-endopeptidase MepM/ murein hydrolase activator NlpD